MKSTTFVRLAGVAGALGGVLWTLMFLARVPDALAEELGIYISLNFVPLLLFLPALVALCRRRGGDLKYARRIGFILAFAGLIVSMVLNLAGFLISARWPGSAAESATTWVYYGGTFALIAGMTILGVVFLKAGTLPRWNDAPLLIGLLGVLWIPFFLWDAPWVQTIVAFSNSTLIVRAAFGVGWVLLGLALFARTSEESAAETDAERKNLVFGPRAGVAAARLERNTEWLVEKLQSIALFDLLEILGKLAILVAVIVFLIGIDDRRKQSKYEAWQVITSAQGQEGTGGRIDALQTLSGAGESLEGVVAEDAMLAGVSLREGTDLDNARFQKSDLSDAELERVFLRNADLEKAKLAGARLDGANLTGVVLREADVSGAELSSAVLSGAQLQDATLQGANLQGANLSDAQLQNANLSGAHLEGATLTGAKLHNTDLSGAWLSEADLELAELENANLKGAVLEGALMDGALLNTDGLVGAKLDGADFRGAVLSGTSDSGADWGTDLRYETDLREVVHLTEKQVEEAKGDKTTLLPEGIDRPTQWNSVTNNMPDMGTLKGGEYFTEEFTPEFSFSPGAGWQVTHSEVQNAVEIWKKDVGYLDFLNVVEVLDPKSPNSGKVLEAPEDVEGMVKWFQDHPYLETGEPGPVSVGGASGTQLDVAARTVPEGYPPDCTEPCLTTFPLADGGEFRFFEDSWNRVMVLDVGGEIVVLSAVMYDATGIRSALESIRWTGAAMPITAGYYFTSVFTPSLSLEVGEGWQNFYELENTYYISREGDSWLSFHNAQEVYDLDQPEPRTATAPGGGVDGMVEWFQDHPYLQAGEPEPFELAGASGKAFDVSVSSAPIDYQCATPCVDLFRDDQGSPFALFAGDKGRVMVLDVEGETLTIMIQSPEEKFEGFSAEAKEVLNSVEWIQPLKTVPPGYRITGVFEPSASFETSGGWQSWYFQPDYYQIWKKDGSFLDFHNAREVYNPESLSLSDLSPAPEDVEGMVKWFQDHPYLEVSEPEPAELAGASGKAFDVSVPPDLPSYPRECADANWPACVPLFRGSDQQPFYLFDGDKYRVMVLDVKGEAVTVILGSPEGTFDGFLAGARDVLDSVEWLKEYAAGETYSTEEFEPSFTFRLDEAWQENQENADYFGITPELGEEDDSTLSFVRAGEVYDPKNPASGEVMPAPEGKEAVVSWLRNHPYLEVGEPEPFEVGGVSGARLDVAISSMPESYPPKCGLPCVPLFQDSQGEPISTYTSFEARFVVLEVDGETVIATIVSREDKFDDFLPQAEEVLSTVDWGE
jgi:uncharacterized protein YjbI with pentapeptide repeats